MSLSDKELVDIRAVAEDWLPDTCTIRTKSESKDALGGVVDSFADGYTGVACRLDPSALSGDERVSSEALEAESFWVLTVAHDQAIGVEDRVVFGGETYEVREVVDDNSFLIVRQAVLVRVE